MYVRSNTYAHAAKNTALPLFRCNVDMLKMIQLGLSFANEKGELPEGGCCTWQFNFAFNLRYCCRIACICTDVGTCVCAPWLLPAMPLCAHRRDAGGMGKALGGGGDA